MDNEIMDFKIMHKLKLMYLGNLGFMALKLDMSKAYNHVKWMYMWEFLLKLRSQGWVKKIWDSISSVQSSIINGDPTSMLSHLEA